MLLSIALILLVGMCMSWICQKIKFARFAWDVGDRCGSRTVCFESVGQQYSWNFIRTPEKLPDYHFDKGRAWAGSVRTEENRKICSDDVLCPCKL